jgi:cobalt-zinc-cadmium efflux system outer membrane protein
MMPAYALSLSYDEALRRAGEANLEVREAQADVRAAEGLVLAARAPFEATLSGSGAWFSNIEEGTNPQFGDYYSESGGWSAELGVTQPLATGTTLGVEMGASQSRYLFRGAIEGIEFETSEEGQFASSLTFTLSQSILQGHRLAYNLQAVRGAKGARTMAQAQRQARRQAVLADTAEAFWAARYQAGLVAIARQTLEIAKEQRRVAQALVEAGRLAPVEGTRAEAAVVQAERALIEAESAAGAADDALLVLVGEAPGTPLEVVAPTPDVPALSLDADAVTEAVLQGNPELTALRVDLDTRRDAVADARHALLPTLAATASYGLQGYEPTLADSLGELGTGNFRDWSVGGVLSVPLTNRADRGVLLQAEAAATSAEIAVRQLEDALVTSARAQVRTLERAARDVELARLNVRLAEETLAAETARLQEGRALQKDVSEALKSLDSARTEAERAVTSFAVALVELERLKGSL